LFASQQWFSNKLIQLNERFFLTKHQNLAEDNLVGLIKINVAELSFVRGTSVWVSNYADPNQNFFFRSNLIIGIRPTSQSK